MLQYAIFSPGATAFPDNNATASVISFWNLIISESGLMVLMCLFV